MREILFRGKRLDSGEWVTSGNIIRFNPEDGEIPVFIPGKNEDCTCVHDADDNILSFEKANYYKVDPDTVGQFTGLTDKNGTKIFEGDILRPFDNEMVVVSWIDHYSTLGLMVYATNTIKKKGREKIETHTGMAMLCDYELNEYEVIGNIHDNPELLCGKEGGI